MSVMRQLQPCKLSGAKINLSQGQEKSCFGQPTSCGGGASYEIVQRAGSFVPLDGFLGASAGDSQNLYLEKERHETFSHFKRFGALYRFIRACGISPER